MIKVVAIGIILPSPVYVLNVSWLMKNFIDRFAFTNHRPRFHRQKLLTVANSGGVGLKECLSSMKYALGGSTIVHELGVSTPPWPQTERAVAKKEKAIRVAAEKLYNACHDASLPSPTLYNYMSFLIQKHIGTECREYLPADYAFYTDKDHYYYIPHPIYIRNAATLYLFAGFEYYEVIGIVKYVLGEFKMKALIVYGTRGGSTKVLAEYIEKALKGKGYETSVRDARERNGISRATTRSASTGRIKASRP